MFGMNLTPTEEYPMTDITIHIDDYVQHRLNALATVHGRTLEEEAQDILSERFPKPKARPRNLAAAIRAEFEPLGGVELELPPRD